MSLFLLQLNKFNENKIKQSAFNFLLNTSIQILSDGLIFLYDEYLVQFSQVYLILMNYNILEQNIEDNFYDAFENSRNAIENAFLMIKMNLGDKLLKQNLQDYISSRIRKI